MELTKSLIQAQLEYESGRSRQELVRIAPTATAVIPVGTLQGASNYVKSGNSSTTGSIAPTLPDGYDYYLVGAALSVAKDATCDIATGSVDMQLLVGGVLTTALRLSVLTTTAQSISNSISLANPLKVEPGTCAITGTFTAGVCNRSYSMIFVRVPQ